MDDQSDGSLRSIQPADLSHSTKAQDSDNSSEDEADRIRRTREKLFVQRDKLETPSSVSQGPRRSQYNDLVLHNRRTYHVAPASVQEIYQFYERLGDFFDLLSNNSSLISVSLAPRIQHKRGAVAEKTTNSLRHALESNDTLRHLSFSKINLKNHGVSQLAAGLAKNSGLKELSLEDAQGGLLGYTQLFESLAHNNPLPRLSLRSSMPLMLSPV